MTCFKYLTVEFNQWSSSGHSCKFQTFHIYPIKTCCFLCQSFSTIFVSPDQVWVQLFLCLSEFYFNFLFESWVYIYICDLLSLYNMSSGLTVFICISQHLWSFFLWVPELFGLSYEVKMIYFKNHKHKILVSDVFILEGWSTRVLFFRDNIILLANILLMNNNNNNVN